ncbi:MAG: carboxypeptidase regulatory-like domain-containing protein, partial [Candidatus Electrothrix sp. AW5]|nr:carboxypeptidase regulatory-like domain-containing protein [Candidatus Electrothrix gigas]
MKIRLAYRILTVLFIGFCSCFLSTTGEVQAGSIEGKVLDSSTSAPIVNLTVGAYHEDDANKLIKYAETNTLGLFTLNNLPNIAESSINRHRGITTGTGVTLCLEIN